MQANANSHLMDEPHLCQKMGEPDTEQSPHHIVSMENLETKGDIERLI